MGKDPAVLFYTSDFLSGTSFFTKAQRGEYITLLCEQHQLYSIPEDHLIEMCGSIDSPVAKKFKKDNDGTWYNQRMRDETIKRKKYGDSRRKNIASRWNKNDKPLSGKKINNIHMNNICNTHVIHMENENENENKDININKKVIPLWREKSENGFQEYLRIGKEEFSKLRNDWNWILQMKQFHHGVNIRLTLDRMWSEFWGTKDGWKNKRAKKTDEPNWKLTIERNFQKSRVFIPRGEDDPEMSEYYHRDDGRNPFEDG